MRAAVVIIVALMTSATLCWASEKTGVYFLYQNEISTKHSGWVFTFTNYLAPYRKHINAVRAELSKFTETVSGFIQIRNHTDMWSETIQFLRKAKDSFTKEYVEIESLYTSAQTMVDIQLIRSKRSILPFVGTILSNLLGTVSEGDLENIRRAIIHLQQNQQKTLHLFNERYSLINLTYERARENRKTINKLTLAVRELNTKIPQLYHQMEVGITNARLVLLIHDIYNIVSRTMMDTRLNLEKLIDLIESANQGHLTTNMLSPQALRRFLTKIKSQLPANSDLPYPLTPKYLPKYYQGLRPILIPGKARFYITIVIPIINNDNRYGIYQVVNEPVYNPETKLSAKIKLETNVLAISTNREKYLLLDSTETISCLNAPFCEVKSPIYDTLNADLCVTALFRKDEHKIKELCRTEILPPDVTPHAHLLFHDQWMVTTIISMKAQKTCTNGNVDLHFNPGQTLFKVEDKCSLNNQYFRIPRRQLGTSETRIQIKFQEDLMLSFNLPSVWNLTYQGLLGVTDNIPPLSPMGNLPIKTFQKALRDLSDDAPFSDTVHRHVNTGLVAGIVCVVLVLVLK